VEKAEVEYGISCGARPRPNKIWPTGRALRYTLAEFQPAIRRIKMTIFSSFRPALTALALGAVFASTTAMAQQAPQGAVRSTHGAWSLICDTPAGSTSEQCALIQNVVAEDRPEVGLSVVVLRTADNQAEILRVLAPLGVLLPNGLGLNVDGEDIGRAYFVRCFQDGCYAEVILEEPLKTTLRNGEAATFIVFQTPEEGIGIPVELEGFGEGFDALP
jgi:invasion protein IalB